MQFSPSKSAVVRNSRKWYLLSLPHLLGIHQVITLERGGSSNDSRQFAQNLRKPLGQRLFRNVVVCALLTQYPPSLCFRHRQRNTASQPPRLTSRVSTGCAPATTRRYVHGLLVAYRLRIVVALRALWAIRNSCDRATGRDGGSWAGLFRQRISASLWKYGDAPK